MQNAVAAKSSLVFNALDPRCEARAEALESQKGWSDSTSSHRSGRALQSLTDDYFARLDALCPEGFTFGFHFRFSRPAFTRTTYREDWMRAYSKWNFIVADPSVVWAIAHSGFTRWSNIDLRDPLGVFSTAAEHGYRYGLTIGHGSQDSRTFGTCARGDREFSDAEAAEISDLVRELHNLITPNWHLKPHQKAALELVARDMTYDAICGALNISRTALKNRLNGAKRVLGASTTAEAVRIALERGILETRSFTGISRHLPIAP
ncbi:LuxR family transcriptional regulator [Limimaricola soesokkakensis]|uniref:Autoinducer binding domain protein n=1 Tax=Limimaricola soesokkakensis TaxID=1343159 RepID=A0A1X7A0S6_9RHOB|nr:LuxR family transcriptional regulator [Limimaricola soesokkakensis]SLN67355.1 Autoinducer binding domain protein [Limimaricola soesokkakensis]